MQNEIWKSVKNYEGLYEVSNFGNVQSLAREVVNKHGKLQKYPFKILKQEDITRDHTTYKRVSLSKDHKVTRHQVHRLVAKAFTPLILNKECVNHKDNNGSNNCVENLEWCTHSENMLHAQAQGRLTKAQSKGGTLGSKPKVTRMLSKINNVYGTQVNAWYILPDSHSSKRTVSANKYNYVNCQCKCGFIAPIEIGRVLRKEITQCITCAQTERNKLKI